MPAPQGQTFFVEPAGGMAANGGLEFQRYAGLVAQQLQARGFQPASSPQSANMIVQFGYGVDHGQTRVVEDPFYRSHLYGGFGWGSGFFHRSRFGWGGGWGWGWDDPFWYGGGVDSYVEYHSQIDLHIRASGTNAAAVRRPRPGALGDQPARRRDPEPGRRDVHRLSGAQRRGDEDHDPDAAAGPLVSQLQI